MIKYPGKVHFHEKPGLVCHYSNRSKVFEHIFHEGQIQFGKMNNTNDQYERKVWDMDINLAEWTTEDDIDKEIEAEKELSKIHSRCSLFCTTIDTHGANDEFLGRGFSIPYLWAHYSENNTGVCLVFDQHKLTEAVHRTAKKNNAKCYDHAVNYDNPPVIGHPAFSGMRTNGEGSVRDMVGQHLETHHETLFFTKNKTWERENEYRYVIVGKDNKPFRINILGTLVGVVLGENFPEPYLPLIENAQKKYGFQSYRIEWSNGWPNVYPYP